jgi:hypothetical protein
MTVIRKGFPMARKAGHIHKVKSGYSVTTRRGQTIKGRSKKAIRKKIAAAQYFKRHPR